MATIFEADWGGGTCPECGDAIERGDYVTYSGNDLIHEECSASTYHYDPLTQLDWEDLD